MKLNFFKIFSLLLWIYLDLGRQEVFSYAATLPKTTPVTSQLTTSTVMTTPLVTRMPYPTKYPTTVTDKLDDVIKNSTKFDKKSITCNKNFSTTISQCEDMLYEFLGAKKDNSDLKTKKLDAFPYRLSKCITGKLYLESIPSLCDSSYEVIESFESIKRNCSNYKNETEKYMGSTKFFDIMGRFCTNKEANSVILSKAKQSNLDECTYNGTGAEIRNEAVRTMLEMEKLVAADIEDIEEYLTNSRSLSDGKTLRSVNSKCGSLRSLNNKLMIEIRRKEKLMTCNNAANELMFQDIYTRLKSTVMTACQIHDVVINGVQSKGNRFEENRFTLALFTLMHIRPVFADPKSESFETCNDTETAIVDLFSNDYIKISGTLHNEKSNDYYFIVNSLSVTLIDGQTTKTLSMKDDAKDLPQAFEDGTTQFGKAKLGKKDKSLIMQDFNSNFMLMISKYNLKSGKAVYSLVLRGAQSVIDESSGKLISGCVSYNDNVKTNKPAPRLVKRSATSDQISEFDKTKTGEDGIATQTEIIKANMKTAENADFAFLKLNNSGNNKQKDQTAVIMGVVMWTIILIHN